MGNNTSHMTVQVDFSANVQQMQSQLEKVQQQIGKMGVRADEATGLTNKINQITATIREFQQISSKRDILPVDLKRLDELQRRLERMGAAFNQDLKTTSFMSGTDKYLKEDYEKIKLFSDILKNLAPEYEKVTNASKGWTDKEQRNLENLTRQYEEAAKKAKELREGGFVTSSEMANLRAQDTSARGRMKTAENRYEDLQNKAPILENKIAESKEKFDNQVKEITAQITAELEQERRALEEANKKIAEEVARDDRIKNGTTSFDSARKQYLAAVPNGRFEATAVGRAFAARDKAEAGIADKQQVLNLLGSEEKLKKIFSAESFTELKQLPQALREVAKQFLEDLINQRKNEAQTAEAKTDLERKTTASQNASAALAAAKSQIQESDVIATERNAEKLKTQLDELTEKEKERKTASQEADKALNEKLAAEIKSNEEKIRSMGVDPATITSHQELVNILNQSKAAGKENAQVMREEAASGAKAFGNSVDGLRDGLNNAKDSMSQLSEKGKDIQNLTNRFKYFFSLTNSFMLFRRAIQGAIREIQTLDKAMTATAVVSTETVSSMWEKLADYTQVASELGSTIEDVVSAQTLFVQQGLDMNNSLNLAVETLKMARIAGIDAAQATDYMTSALRGFNMELNETSAQRINDVYSELAKNTAADTQEISVAMSKVASIANSANMSFENTAAFLSQIIETTRESAETAGTALKTVIGRFSEVKKLYSEGELEGTDEEGEGIDVNKISAALRTAGINMNEYFLGNVGLDEIFMELASKWDSLTEVQKRYIATQAAGSRQQSRFIALMQNYERTVELTNMAMNAAGSSEEQFNKTLESLDAKLNQLKDAWNTFLMGITNSDIVKNVIDTGTKIITIINKIIDSLSAKNGLAKSILSIGTAIGTLKIGKSLIGNFASFIGQNMGFGNGLNNLSGVSKAGMFAAGGMIPSISKKSFANFGASAKNKMALFGNGFMNGLMGNSVGDLIDARTKAFNGLNSLLDNDTQNSPVDWAAQGIGVNNREEALRLREAINNNTISNQDLNLINSKLNTKAAILSEKVNKTAAGSFFTGMAFSLAAAIASPILNQKSKEQEERYGRQTQKGAIQEGVSEGLATSAGIMSVAASTKNIWAVIAGFIASAGITIEKAVTKGGEWASLEKELERTQAGLENTRIYTDELNSSYTNLKNTISSLKELDTSFDGLSKGTQEWAEQVFNVNSQYLDLIEKYPQLSPFLETKNGILTIDWSQVELEKIIQDEYKKITTNKIAEQVLTGNIAQKNKELLTTDYEDKYKFYDVSKEHPSQGDLNISGLELVTGTHYNGDKYQYDDAYDKKFTEKMATAVAEGKNIAIWTELQNLDFNNEEALNAFDDKWKTKLATNNKERDKFKELLQQAATMDWEEKDAGVLAYALAGGRLQQLRLPGEVDGIADQLGLYKEAMQKNDLELHAAEQSADTLVINSLELPEEDVNGFSNFARMTSMYDKAYESVLAEAQNEDGNYTKDYTSFMRSHYNDPNLIVNDDGSVSNQTGKNIATSEEAFSAWVAYKLPNVYNDYYNQLLEKNLLNEGFFGSFINGAGLTTNDILEAINKKSSIDGIFKNNSKLFDSLGIDKEKLIDAYDKWINKQEEALQQNNLEFGNTKLIHTSNLTSSQLSGYTKNINKVSETLGMDVASSLRTEIDNFLRDYDIDAEIMDALNAIDLTVPNAYNNLMDTLKLMGVVTEETRAPLETFINQLQNIVNMGQDWSLEELQETFGKRAILTDTFKTIAENPTQNKISKQTMEEMINAAYDAEEKQWLNDNFQQMGKEFIFVGNSQEALNKFNEKTQIITSQYGRAAYAKDRNLAQAAAEIKANPNNDELAYLKQMGQRSDFGYNINGNNFAEILGDEKFSGLTWREIVASGDGNEIVKEARELLLEKIEREVTQAAMKTDGKTYEEVMGVSLFAGKNAFELMNGPLATLDNDNINISQINAWKSVADEEILKDMSGQITILDQAMSQYQKGEKDAIKLQKIWNQTISTFNGKMAGRFQNNLNDIYKEFKEVDKESAGYTNILNELNGEIRAEALKAFNVDIGDNFFTDAEKGEQRLQWFQEAMEGAGGAWENLWASMNLADYSFLDEIINQFGSMSNMIDVLNNSHIQITGAASLDVSNLMASLNISQEAAASLLAYLKQIGAIKFSPIMKDIPANILNNTHAYAGAGIEMSSVIGDKYIAGFDVSFDSSKMSVPPNTLKTPGGGGGGGSKKDKAAEKLDPLYNTLDQINETERQRNKLETEYQIAQNQEIVNAKTLYKIKKDQLDQIRKEGALQEELAKGRLKELNNLENTKHTEGDVTKTYKAWGVKKYLNYDPNTGLMTLNDKEYAKLDEVKDADLINAIKDFEKEYNEKAQSYEEAIDAAEQATLDEQELIKESLDEIVDTEDRVREALMSDRQKEIDALSAFNEALNDSNERILDSIERSIDLSRQIRDNTKTEEDIASKEARLAYLRRDTSGANALEIQKLEKELEDDRQDYQDTLEDQALERLQTQADDAAEARERQIKLMEKQLAWDEENGAYNDQIMNLLATAFFSDGVFNPDSELGKLLKEAEGFDSMTEAEQKKWLQETSSQIASYRSLWKLFSNPENGINIFTPRYATGGLADFTGPAWLDGSPSKPELVLNPSETASFLELAKVLEQFMHNNSTLNTKDGSVKIDTIDIDINVDEIGSEYDVDQLANDIKSRLYNSGVYRNVNALGRNR